MSLATMASRSQVLGSALELDLFTVIGEESVTIDWLCGKLGLHQRYARDFLDVLVAIDLLQRDGDSYANTPVTKRFLDRDSADYLGGYIPLLTGSWQHAWGQLTSGLRTGEVETQPRGGFVAGSNKEDSDRFHQVVSVMDRLSMRIGEELVSQVDWDGVKDVGDLGGGRGGLAAILAKSVPGLSTYCFERPQAREHFDEHLAELGMTGRVEFVGGDLFTDPIPEADVLIYGQVLHGWEDAEREVLVRRAFEALRPGGTLFVYDRMIDDERSDPRSLMYSLYMRLVSPAGSEYRATDCRAWMRAAGFQRTWSQPLLLTHTLVGAQR
jgi:SAM-dependent methyltransferase